MACFSLSLAKTHSMASSAYRRNGHPYRCWISTILNSTTRFMLGLPLYSQYNDSTISYRHLKLFPEANDPLVPSSLFSPSLSHYDPFSTFPYLNHYLRSLTLSKNELLTMHLRQYKTAKDRQQIADGLSLLSFVAEKDTARKALRLNGFAVLRILYFCFSALFSSHFRTPILTY